MEKPEEKGSLEVVEEKTVLFYEDEIIAVKVEDGTIYVPVRRLCDNLGLTWGSQYNRINRDEVLSEAAQGVFITKTPSAPGGRGGGPQEMLCLPLDLIPGWLFGVQTSRVNEEIRDKLIRYRRECFRVLWDAFRPNILPGFQEPATDLTPTERALVLAEAVAAIARNQIATERWLKHHDQRLDDVEEVVEDLRLRLQGPEPVVTDRQAAEIATAVKTIAYNITKQDKSRNWFQSVYGELYRRFGVTSYKQVPAEQFGAVMKWLKEYAERFE